MAVFLPSSVPGVSSENRTAPEALALVDGLTAMALGAMSVAFPQFGLDTAPLADLGRELSAMRAELGLNDGPGAAG